MPTGQWRHASHLSRYEDGDIGGLESLMETQQKLMMNKGIRPNRVDNSHMIGILDSDYLDDSGARSLYLTIYRCNIHPNIITFLHMGVRNH